MILILDKQHDIKSWLSAAPLHELDLMDVGGMYTLQMLERAHLIIIADYEGAQFRVMKNRLNALYVTDHISKLGEFVSEWVGREFATRAQDWDDEENGR